MSTPIIEVKGKGVLNIIASNIKVDIGRSKNNILTFSAVFFESI